MHSVSTEDKCERSVCENTRVRFQQGNILFSWGGAYRRVGVVASLSPGPSSERGPSFSSRLCCPRDGCC